MQFRKGLEVLTLSCFLLGCQPKYEPISQEDAYRQNFAYLRGRHVEIHGTMINPSNGYLYFGTPLISLGIFTDCADNRKKSDKLSAILAKIGDMEGLDFCVRGTFSKKKPTSEKILEVKQIIIKTEKKDYNIKF